MARPWLQVSMWAMPMYSILPAVTEWVVEQGWTRSYTRIGEVGTLKYLTLFAVYMCCVEYFVYWSHRSLHDIRLGYRCVWLSLQSVEDLWPVLLLEELLTSTLSLAAAGCNHQCAG